MNPLPTCPVRRGRHRGSPRLLACTALLAVVPTFATAESVAGEPGAAARTFDAPPPWGTAPLPVPPLPPSGCRGETVGRVVGGLLGAAIARQIAGDDRRTLGTVGGALAGVWIGGTVGRQMDAGQPGCGGRAAETPPAQPLPPDSPPGGPRSTWRADGA